MIQARGLGQTSISGRRLCIGMNGIDLSIGEGEFVAILGPSRRRLYHYPAQLSVDDQHRIAPG